MSLCPWLIPAISFWNRRFLEKATMKIILRTSLASCPQFLYPYKPAFSTTLSFSGIKKWMTFRFLSEHHLSHVVIWTVDWLIVIKIARDIVLFRFILIKIILFSFVHVLVSMRSTIFSSQSFLVSILFSLSSSSYGVTTYD